SGSTIPFGVFAPLVPDGDIPRPLDRLQVLRAVAQALLAGGRPVVVAVDDAHLLDEGSAAVVLHLATHTEARVVATIRRGESCPDAVTALWKEDLAELIELDALSEAETVALIGRVLPGPVRAGALRRLWALSAGVPLYLREIVRAAQAQGVLTSGVDGWRWQGELSAGGRLADLLAHA